MGMPGMPGMPPRKSHTIWNCSDANGLAPPPMGGPPAPPPPSGAPAAPPAMQDRGALLQSIQLGKGLRKVKTVEKGGVTGGRVLD